MRKELLRKGDETVLAWIKRLYEITLHAPSLEKADPEAILIVINHVPTLVEMAERSIMQSTASSSTDVLGMTRDELISEIKRLRNGIRQHRDEKGNGRCWLDDHRLYSLLPESAAAETQLPPKCEFLRNCARYWESRQSPEEKARMMNAAQKARFDDWLAIHNRSCQKVGLPFSERFDFKFSETGVGTAVSAHCTCGAKTDVTDYENW